MRARTDRLLLLLATAAIGCSSPEGSHADAGSSFDENAAYWGFADKECLHFDDGSGTNPDTVYVTIDNGVKIGGVTTYELYWTADGFQVVADLWLGFIDDNVVLYSQDIPPAGSSSNDTYITYAPPPPYLVKDLGAGTTVTNSTTASFTGAMTQMVMQSWTVGVESVGPVMADGQQSLTATLYDIIETDSSNQGNPTTNQVWFAPQVGIVQLGQPNGMANLVLTSIGQNVAAGDCHP